MISCLSPAVNRSNTLWKIGLPKAACALPWSRTSFPPPCGCSRWASRTRCAFHLISPSSWCQEWHWPPHWHPHQTGLAVLSFPEKRVTKTPWGSQRVKVRRNGVSSNKGKEKDTDPHTAHDSNKRALPALAMEQFCHSWGSSAHSQALQAQWPWHCLHRVVFHSTLHSMQCTLCGNLFFSVGNLSEESKTAFLWLLHIVYPIFFPWVQQANCSLYWKPFILLVSHVDLVCHDTSCGQLCPLHTPQYQTQLVSSWMIKTSGQNLVTAGGKNEGKFLECCVGFNYWSVKKLTSSWFFFRKISSSLRLSNCVSKSDLDRVSWSKSGRNPLISLATLWWRVYSVSYLNDR